MTTFAVTAVTAVIAWLLAMAWLLRALRTRTGRPMAPNGIATEHVDPEQRAPADAADSDTPAATHHPARGTVFVIATALPAAAVVLYALLGSPHAIQYDATPAVTPADAASPSTQRAQLQAHLAGAPRDGRAWVLLARLYVEDKRYTDATNAYERALGASPNKVARDPLIWCELADAVALTQNRVLAGKPAELIERALALDPAFPRALEMAGGAAVEVQDYRRASLLWRELLRQIPRSTPEHAQLAAALATVDRLAGFSPDEPRNAQQP